jgi:hypothetical protein
MACRIMEDKVPLSKSLMGSAVLVGLVIITLPASAGGLDEFVQEAAKGKVDLGPVRIDVGDMKINPTSPFQPITGPTIGAGDLTVTLNPGPMGPDVHLEGDSPVAEFVKIANDALHVPQDVVEKIFTDTVEGAGNLIAAPFRAIGHGIDEHIDKLKKMLDEAKKQGREGAPIALIWVAGALFLVLFLAKFLAKTLSAVVLALFRRRSKRVDQHAIRRAVRARRPRRRTVYVGGRPTATGY